VILDEGADESTALNAIGWTTLAGPVTTTVSVPVTPVGDGYKRAYIHVRDASNNIPTPAYDRSFMDVNDPTVSIVSGPTTVLAASSSTQALDASASDGSGSGLDSSSYAWTTQRLSGSGELTFTKDSVLDTSVYDNGTNADGIFRLRITVTDKAGRSGTTYRDVTWDRSAPGVSISGSSYDLSSPLSWSWSSSATDLDRYEYSWTGSSYTNYGTSTSINRNVSSYGPYVLYVRAYDDNGNVSNDSDTTYYSPSNIRPYWGERRVSVYADIDWPAVNPVVGGTVKYDLYLWRNKIDRSPIQILDDSVDHYFDHPIFKGAAFDGTTQYFWYYEAWEFRFGYKPMFRARSDTYTFWTE
jgi:hypothetical protein